MNENKMKFSYEDTDKSIEIDLYDLVFEINNLDNLKDIKGLNKGNKEEIEDYIKRILGEDAIDKINDKRKRDGYKELDLNIELGILGCIFKTYTAAMVSNFTDKIDEAGKDIDNNIVRFNNREDRRNYNKNYNRNQYNRGRNYRRY